MAHKSRHHLFQGLLPEHEVASLSSCECLVYNGSFVAELGASSFWQVCQQSRSSLVTQLFYFILFFCHYFRKRKLSTLLRDLLEILCQYLACILSGVVYMVEKHEVAPQASSPYLSVRIFPKHIHLECAPTWRTKLLPLQTVSSISDVHPSQKWGQGTFWSFLLHTSHLLIVFSAII